MTGHFFSWIRIRIRGLFHLIKLLFAVEEHLCWAEFVNDNCMNTLADFSVNIGWLSKVSSCICFVHFRTRNGPEGGNWGRYWGCARQAWHWPACRICNRQLIMQFVINSGDFPHCPNTFQLANHERENSINKRYAKQALPSCRTHNRRSE